MGTILMLVKCLSTFQVYKLVKHTPESNIIPTITNLEIHTNDRLWKLYISQSILLQSVLPTMSLVIIGHYTFGYKPPRRSTMEILESVQVHGLNLVFLWTDFLISAERMYYKACFWTVSLGTIYTFWAIIYENCIYGYNDLGE